MLTPFHTARIIVLSIALAWMGSVSSLGQSPAPNISPELAHRLEAMIRSKVDLPSASSISFSSRSTSEIPGFDRLDAHFSSSFNGATGNISLLLSKDGTRVAQFTSYDIGTDPRLKFPADDRPSRGGPANAPVVIVGYDDLECPYCAQLHAELFPALTDRYKDQVRIVYRSYPSEGHPWAMRAAVDTDCLGAESAPAYWAAVDHIHAHSAEYGGTEHSLTKAQQQIDEEVKEQGQSFRVDGSVLNACIARQDTAPQNASLRQGEQLGVIKTPTLFINGVKIDGAVPIKFMFEMVDNALKASGNEPPTPYQEKTTPTQPPRSVTLPKPSTPPN
jgi:protein-disulfide isomerase